MNQKIYAVIKHIKSVIVRIPFLQFDQIPHLERIRVTSDNDVKNDIHKIKNL